MPDSGRPPDPFTSFVFELKIDGIVAGGFSECTGLDMGMEVVEYREGGVNDRVHKFPGGTIQANLLLKRGIVDRELSDWYERASSGQPTLKDGSILVYDRPGGSVTMEWRFLGAFPCRWIGPELNALESRIAVEALELSHQGLRRAT